MLNSLINKIRKISKLEGFFLIVLLFFSTYSGIKNYSVLKEDSTPFAYDIYDSYALSEKYYGLLKAKKVSSFIHEYVYHYQKDYPPSWIFQLLDYPPILIFQPFPFYFIMGVSEDTAAFSNIIHVFILLFSTYFFGKKIKNSYVGFLSSLMLFFIPGFLSFSRVYLPDFALASFTILSITLFFYSDFLKKRKISIFLGISLGMGMLAKITYPIYVLPLILIYLIKFCFKKRTKGKIISKKQLKNFIFLLVFFSLIISLWYPLNFINTVKTYQRSKDIFYIDNSIFINLLLWYFDILNNIFAHYLFFFIVVTVYFIIKSILDKKRTSNSKISPIDLIIAIIITILPFLSLYHESRYILPILPFVAILFGIFLFEIITKINIHIVKKKKIAYILFLISIILIIITANFCNYNYLNSRNKYQAQNLYKGLMISNKNYVILNNLSLLIDTSIEKINGSKILSLYDSSFLFGKLREFKTKYDVSEPVFCLRRPDLIDWYMECNMGVVLTKEFICSQDLVIYSNIPMIKNAREMLQQGFPERWESYILINETWKECKNNYSLLDTIPNIPLEDNITPLIYIYLKKEDKNEKFI